MASHSSTYTVHALLGKFAARPWRYKWQYAWAVARGLLRRHTFESGHLIMLGPGVMIDKCHGRITSSGICVVQSGCRIAVHGEPGRLAHLHIGEGTEIGPRTLINVCERIEIGDRCSISWDCDINDSDFHHIMLMDSRPPLMTEPIVIENDVWIGTRCLILKGVTIGHHSVIGAGSVVRHAVPPHSLVIGNPGRRVGEVAGWQR